MDECNPLIDGIFIAAAFKSKEEAELLGIGKKSLGRHEFMEAVVRMAEAKFGHDQRKDVSSLKDAVDVCCRNQLQAGAYTRSLFSTTSALSVKRGV